MATNPQQSALPWAQTLAGLFGGVVNARQQAIQNPRAGFSYLPILSGAANGLATGLASSAARQEQLRQEGRTSNDALAWLAASTGLTPEEITQKMGGLTPKAYNADAAKQFSGGLGQQFIAGQMGLNDPGGWQSVDSGLAGNLLPKVYESTADNQALGQLPQLRGAGYNDAGGPRTPNAVPFYTAPTVDSVMPGIRASIQGGTEAVPGIKTGYTSSSADPNNPILSTVGTPNQLLPLVGQGGGLPTLPTAPQVPGEPQLDAGQQLNAAASMQQPMTLADAARSGSNIKALQAMYQDSANAANSYNTNVTQRFNTAQQVSGQNQRAALDFNTPTPAWIAAYGTPEQKASLQQYAEAGARSRMALYGTDKPATRGEIKTAADDVANSLSPEAAQTKIDRYVGEGTITPQQGIEAYNTGIFGQNHPIVTGAPQAGPQQVYPGINQFLPGPMESIYGAPRIPKASQGAVRKVIRDRITPTKGY